MSLVRVCPVPLLALEERLHFSESLHNEGAHYHEMGAAVGLFAKDGCPWICDCLFS